MLAIPGDRDYFFSMKPLHDQPPVSGERSGQGRVTVRHATLPVGVVVRVTPGRSRWAGWSRKAVAVLPGAGEACWKELRRDGHVAEYHAGTLPLELYRADTEAYRQALSARTPSLFVVMRDGETGPGGRPDDMELVLVTASPFEAQDYLDSGEEIVEPVSMPPGLIAWIQAFVEIHHRDETFHKRQRDRVRIDIREDGKGDPRIVQATDVYRAPRPLHRRMARTGPVGETVH